MKSLLGIVAVAACASLANAAPPPVEPERFLEVQEMATRPVAAAGKLAALVAPICAGKGLQHLGQLPYTVKGTPEASERDLKIAQILQERYGVLPGEAVFLQDQPSTPYGQAGIKKGDRWSLEPASKTELAIKRGKEVIRVRPQAIATCPVQVEVLDSRYTYAESHGRTIQLTVPLLNALDDDELLAILAHEYAHTILEHRRLGGDSHLVLGMIVAMHRNSETRTVAYADPQLIAADRLTLWLLQRSGVELTKYKAVLQKLESTDLLNRPTYTRTRPMSLDRWKRLEAAIARWQTEQRLPIVEGIDTQKLRAMRLPAATVAAKSEPAAHAETPPPASGFAALEDVDAVPGLRDKGRELYREYLEWSAPKAAAVSGRGVITRARGTDSMAQAVARCEKLASGPCRLYAVDNIVVWSPAATVAAKSEPAARAQTPPPASGFAALEDVDAVPRLSAKGRELYREYLEWPAPKAVAISERGALARGRGKDATAQAIVRCERFGNPCRLYAVDDVVVWSPLSENSAAQESSRTAPPPAQ